MNIFRICSLLVPLIVSLGLFVGTAKAEVIEVPVTFYNGRLDHNIPYIGQTFHLYKPSRLDAITVHLLNIVGIPYPTEDPFPFRVLITGINTEGGLNPTNVNFESDTLISIYKDLPWYEAFQSFKVNLNGLLLQPGTYAVILDGFVTLKTLPEDFRGIAPMSGASPPTPPTYEGTYIYYYHGSINPYLPEGTREDHFVASNKWRTTELMDMAFRLEYSVLDKDIMLRDEIAERLGVYVHGSSHTPPIYLGVYDDVMIGEYNADWIQQLYDDGITKGCNYANTLYCPKDPVDKSQAIKMILRADYGGSHLPPDASTMPFADVPLSHPDVDWIAQAKDESITFGCGDGSNFCPRELLTEAGYYRLTCNTPHSGIYLGNVTTVRNRCDGTQDYPIQPINIVVNPNCSVDISYTVIRPFTGTGVLRGNASSVNISRTEDCSAVTGKNDGTGLVTSAINGASITGNTFVGGTCDCQGLPNTKWDITGNYTATLQ